MLSPVRAAKRSKSACDRVRASMKIMTHSAFRSGQARRGAASPAAARLVAGHSRLLTGGLLTSLQHDAQGCAVEKDHGGNPHPEHDNDTGRERPIHSVIAPGFDHP